MWDWISNNTSVVQGGAAAIQGVAAIANLLVTVALAWFTRRYVNLTRDQVQVLVSEKSRAASAEFHRAHLYIARFNAIIDQLPYNEHDFPGLIRMRLWGKDETQRLLESVVFIAPTLVKQAGYVQEHLDAILDERAKAAEAGPQLPANFESYNTLLIQAKMAIEKLDADLDVFPLPWRQ